MNGPLPLDAVDLAVAASLVVVNGLLSLWLGLRMERALLVASVRTVVQLLLLGLILEPIFGWQRPVAVLAVCVAMGALAAREAVRRSERSYRGIHLTAGVALAVGCGSAATLGTAVVIGVDPWWTPQYLVPVVGMLLGNTLTGLSVGIDRALKLLDEERRRVDALLALGATWWEASRPIAAEALRAGLIPVVNAMSVVGVVTIPGMMTGQILGGAAPALAARYQIVIMFLIAASTGLGTGIAVLATVRAVFDGEHRLRAGRIQRS